jgi:hypothetical protein
MVKKLSSNHSKMGIKGGMPIIAFEKLILRIIKKGTKKNKNNQM